MIRRIMGSQMTSIHIQDFARLVPGSDERPGFGFAIRLAIRLKIDMFFAERSIIANLDRFTKRVESHFLIYTGMLQIIKSSPPDLTVEAREALIAGLEEAEADYLEMRAEMLDYLTDTSPNRTSLVLATKKYISALADCFEVVQETRWLMLDLEAQANIDSGNVKSFTSIDDALASFD